MDSDPGRKNDKVKLNHIVNHVPKSKLIPRCSVTDLLLELNPKPTLELFPGSQVWTTAHHKIGFKHNVVHDWANGMNPQYDMTNRDYVFGSLVPSLESGTYSCVHIATECTTFSTMTGSTYRTCDEPLGTKECLARGDAKATACLAANEYGSNSVRAYLAADAGGSISSLENPKGSRFWPLPCAQVLLQRIKDGELDDSE